MLTIERLHRKQSRMQRMSMHQIEFSGTEQTQGDTEPREMMKRSINKNEYCQRELGKVRGLEMARGAVEHSAAERIQQEANAQKIDWLAAAIAQMDGISVTAKKLKVSRGTVYNWLDKGLAHASLGTVVAISRQGNTPIEYLIGRMGPFKPIGATTRHGANGSQR